MNGSLCRCRQERFTWLFSCSLSLAVICGASPLIVLHVPSWDKPPPPPFVIFCRAQSRMARAACVLCVDGSLAHVPAASRDLFGLVSVCPRINPRFLFVFVACSVVACAFRVVVGLSGLVPIRRLPRWVCGCLGVRVVSLLTRVPN